MKKIYFNFHWSFLVLGFLLVLFNKGLVFLYYVLFGILHEFGHAVVGRLLGYRLNVITLMPYGACLSGNNTPLKPKDEIKIALAGPLVNITVILICVLLNNFGITLEQIELIKNINISYLMFNLLPVFPLDGARIILALLTLKLKRKTAFKIVNIIGWLVTFLYFVLFVISIFKNLNFMMGINTIFLLIGLFSNDTTAYYVNIKSINQSNYKIKKGSEVKVFAINENANLFETYKLLDKYNINQIMIFDENNNLKSTMMDFDFEKYLLSKPLETKLADVI